MIGISLLTHNSLATEKHGSEIYQAFILETDYGTNGDDPITSWDLDGWIGNNDHKLWLKSEGEIEEDQTEQAEFWALYSHNIAEFWDAQIGLRYDDQPNSIIYFTAGINGLAPYFFETEAHLFISEDGDITARFRQERDFLITQKLITQPYIEVNLSAQDVPEQSLGAGITDGEIGLQTRYEITRKFAPYLDLRYERKLGETASIHKRDSDEDIDHVILSAGLRFMF